jgi:hypothetical protein
LFDWLQVPIRLAIRFLPGMAFTKEKETKPGINLDSIQK